MGSGYLISVVWLAAAACFVARSLALGKHNRNAKTSLSIRRSLSKQVLALMLSILACPVYKRVNNIGSKQYRECMETVTHYQH